MIYYKKIIIKPIDKLILSQTYFIKSLGVCKKAQEHA